jgi:TctA family transporter
MPVVEAIIIGSICGFVPWVGAIFYSLFSLSTEKDNKKDKDS